MTGKVVDRTFNAGAKIETETVDRSDFQYLYKDGDGFVFMDTNDYDQITLDRGARSATRRTSCSRTRT